MPLALAALLTGALLLAPFAAAQDTPATKPSSPASPAAPASPPIAPVSPPTTPPPAAPPQLLAKVTTSRGFIKIKLHPETAPIAVTNFCNLAKKKFFDGLPFWAHTFVLRLTGRPFEGFNAGYTFRRELSPKHNFSNPHGGAVAMFNLEEKSDTSCDPTQWFVTVKDQERWNLDYTIFGTIIEGQTIANALEKGDTVVSVEIEGDTAPLFRKYAEQVKTWDTALTKSGWKPGMKPPGSDAPPPNPNPPSSNPRPPRGGSAPGDPGAPTNPAGPSNPGAPQSPPASAPPKL